MDNVSWRVYVDARFKAIHAAVKEANQTLNHRLKGMNEFRQQMNDQTKTFLAKEEYEARHRSLENRISGLERIVWGGLGALGALQVILTMWKH